MRRLAIDLDDAQAGNLTLEGTRDAGVHTIFKHVARNLLDTSYKLGFLEGAVTNDHRFLKHLDIHPESEVDYSPAGYCFLYIGVTDAGTDQACIRIYTDVVSAGYVGGSAAGLALDKDDCPGHRFTGGGIRNNAGYTHFLSHCTCSSQKQSKGNQCFFGEL